MSKQSSLYVRYGKRCLDLAICVPALLVLLPLYFALAALILWRMGRPVLFWQPRPGLAGEPFWMVKFRSMTGACNEFGQLLPDEQRLTLFGRFLRRTSMDELPEFWNVLRGDMSLVGPRPLLTEYMKLYTPQQARRHKVKPGITGWAQANDRNQGTWEDRFRDDLWYVNNVSFWVDIKILLRTIPAVILQKNISANSHPTFPRFTGSSTHKDRHEKVA